MRVIGRRGIDLKQRNTNNAADDHHDILIKPYESPHEKTCLRGFRPGETQAGLLSNRDKLES